MALKLSFTCPTHLRYNPESGQGAIRGGCIYCNALFEIYRHANLIWRNIGKDGAVEPEPIKPYKKGTPGDRD